MLRLTSTIVLIAAVISGEVWAACPEATAVEATTAAVPASCPGAAPAPATAARPVPVDPAAGYQKKTEFDNTPYRFNAEKGFTAAEFEAWMAARGIRIATGKPTRAPVAAPATAGEPADPAPAAVVVPAVVETGAVAPSVVPAVATMPAPAPAASAPAAAPVVPACPPGTGVVSC